MGDAITVSSRWFLVLMWLVISLKQSFLARTWARKLLTRLSAHSLSSYLDLVVGWWCCFGRIRWLFPLYSHPAHVCLPTCFSSLVWVWDLGLCWVMFPLVGRSWLWCCDKHRIFVSKFRFGLLFLPFPRSFLLCSFVSCVHVCSVLICSVAFSIFVSLRACVYPVHVSGSIVSVSSCPHSFLLCLSRALFVSWSPFP